MTAGTGRDKHAPSRLVVTSATAPAREICFATASRGHPPSAKATTVYHKFRPADGHAVNLGIQTCGRESRGNPHPQRAQRARLTKRTLPMSATSATAWKRANGIMAYGGERRIRQRQTVESGSDRSDLLSTDAKPRLAHGFATDKTLVLFLGGLGTEEPEARINSIKF